MLKNPLHVYSDENVLKLPAHLHYGKHMLHKYGGYGDKQAVVNAETGESLTFKELRQKAVDIALSLVRMGVRKGEVVGICSEKNLEFLPTVLGIICAGATFTGVDITGGRASILHRAELSKPVFLFCSPAAYKIHEDTIKRMTSVRKVIMYEGGDEKRDGVTMFSQFLTETTPVDNFLPVTVNGWNDFAVILYSSGTTGLPKGIPMTHRALMHIVEDLGDKKLIKGTSTLITREWYYSYGLIHTLVTLDLGSTVVYCPTADVKHYIEAIQKCKIQVIQVAPATVTELVNSPFVDQHDVSSLTCLISSSTNISPDVIEAVKTRFPNLGTVCQCYGMSEAGYICSDWRAPKGPRPGSVGRPIEAFTLKIADLNTREALGPNQRGEICYKSPSLMLGYIGNADPDCIDEEGFFKTGDIGYYDDDQYFYIVDRIKELIKFNSFQVAPAELEMVLYKHPAVLMAGVAGAPHAEYGEVPTAFVVLRPAAQATEEEIIKYVDGEVSYRNRLAGGVRFVKQLPLGAGDKLDRKTLKKILVDEANNRK